jgi:hypothetical protein
MDLRYEFVIAWDGDPSMSGSPRRHQAGSFTSLEFAKQALDSLPSAKNNPERNYRVEKRLVGGWETV